MNRAWLQGQAKLFDALRELGQHLRVTDVAIDPNGQVYFTVENHKRESWIEEQQLHAVVERLQASNVPMRVQYKGWRPTPRPLALFLPGTTVEILCAWVAEPNWENDALTMSNDCANLLLQRKPDVLWGWCPGTVRTIKVVVQGNKPELQDYTSVEQLQALDKPYSVIGLGIELQRHIFQDGQVGSTAVSIGIQSPQLRKA